MCDDACSPGTEHAETEIRQIGQLVSDAAVDGITNPRTASPAAAWREAMNARAAAEPDRRCRELTTGCEAMAATRNVGDLLLRAALAA